MFACFERIQTPLETSVHSMAYQLRTNDRNRKVSMRDIQTLNVKRGIVNKVVFILYALFIAFVSLRPMNSATLEPWDKVFHLILYGVFSLLGYRASKEPKQFLYICTGIVIYSGLMEVGQSFMPGRVMSVYDLLANTIGVVLGAAIAKKVFSANNI